jgi:hypothetical protein
VLVETVDVYILFCLRGSKLDYFPLHWSVSFEEQLEVGERTDLNLPADRDPGPDVYLSDTVARGLRQELGLEGPVDATLCFAIGREYMAPRPKSEHYVFNAGLFVWTKLKQDLDEVWKSLRDRPNIVDRQEHVAWMGCRFDRSGDVARFLSKFAREFGPGPLETAGSMVVDYKVFREAAQVSLAGSLTEREVVDLARGFSWHPTSKARLCLWSRSKVAEFGDQPFGSQRGSSETMSGPTPGSPH